MVTSPNIRLQLSKKPRDSGGLSRHLSEGMRKPSLCPTAPHLELCVGSLHCFPPSFLEEHAEELGVVERDRKLQIPAFVWAFVFGFAAGESRTLAGFRRSYNSTADETISPSGFYQWLTPTLAEYFRDLVEARSRRGRCL